jgi:predicted GNAT superfamily acetyltransferase
MGAIKIETAGKQFCIEVCNQENELAVIKKLDDSIFSKHQGISNELLSAIFHQGGLLIYKIDNRIVAESQVLFEPAAGQSIENKQSALFYGTAVVPDFRGQHIGEALALAQEKTALSKDKSHALLSVRPENAASICLRMKLGFTITRWQTDYYGSGRLIMEKALGSQPLLKSKSYTKIVKSIILKTGDQPDEHARTQLAASFLSGFKPVTYHIINPAEAVLGFSE